MKDLFQLIERYVNMFSKCRLLELDKKDLHYKEMENSINSMIYATNVIKLSISNEINNIVGKLSSEELNFLLSYIEEKISDSEKNYKRDELSLEESDSYYYRYCAYNELKNYIYSIKEERIIK